MPLRRLGLFLAPALAARLWAGSALTPASLSQTASPFSRPGRAYSESPFLQSAPSPAALASPPARPDSLSAPAAARPAALSPAAGVQAQTTSLSPPAPLAGSATASAAPPSAGEAPVLLSICYHRFGPESSDAYCMSLPRLEAELKWLKSDGWANVSLTQVAAALQGQPGALPPKGVLLSVDDGFRSGGLGAELFERYGYRGVFFVYPAALGRGSFFRWDELRDLERRGHAVASHSLSHPNLAKVRNPREPQDYAAWVDKELGLSRSLLERELGHPVDALAWPYGAYNPALVAAAQRQGYRQLWTVSGGLNVGQLDGLRLRRVILMGHPSLASFRNHCRALPVQARLEGLSEGSLLYRSQMPHGVRVRGRVQAGLGGLPLSLAADGSASLDGGLANGFHYLTLDERGDWGLRRTPFLFQLAPDAWKAAFAAAAAGRPLSPTAAPPAAAPPASASAAASPRP